MNISRFALSPLAVVVLLIAPGRLHAALLDALPVHRIQLMTTTCNLPAAGTDNSVQVKLNAANSTWLDYSHNDFARGASFTYDLGLEHILILGDISTLQISKKGSDSWCLRRLKLYVNNSLIFEKVYPPSGRWLNNRRRDRPKLTITGEQLRRDPNWAAYTPQLPPDRIRRRELESRIESAVGDALHGQKLTWRRSHGRAVDLGRRSQLRYRGDIHLELRLDNWHDPEVDVSFQLAISCGVGQLTMRVQRLKIDVDSPWYADLATLGALDGTIEDRLRQALRNVPLRRSTTILICPPALGIMRNGDLRLY